MNSIVPDSLCKPDRFAEVARLHTNAFNWRPQGRIPLGIHVVEPRHAKNLDYNRWLDPEPFLAFQTNVLIDTLRVGSDLLPAVAVNHLGDAVITSMFGARQFLPESAGTNLQDVGPTPLPVFSRIEDVTGLSRPGLDAGIMPQVLDFARYYRRHLPEWVRVIAPMPSGPFSAAMSLRGSEFLLDLVDSPHLCHKLVDLCNRLQWDVEQAIRTITGEPLGHHVTNFGIQGAGLRLGEDSWVNLSPTFIRDFCLPHVANLNRWCGGRGPIHFCSLDHSRHEHIYAALVEAPEVAVVSSQFGFEYYERHLQNLKGHLAIESFYGDALAYVTRKYGSFRAWTNSFVPRFKNESGLVLYCTVPSLEQAREMWAYWTEAHAK